MNKKKPDPIGPGFPINSEKVTTPNPNYFFFDFVNPFKRSETKKLTVAPITAKIIVLRISSEKMLGAILNNVPEAVPILVVTLVSISRFI